MSKRSLKLHEFIAHSTHVSCLKLGKKAPLLLVTGGEDRKVNIWTLDTFIVSLSGHTSAVECVTLDPAEEAIVAGAASGVVKLWDLDEARVVRSFNGHQSNCVSVDFHPFGAFFASGSLDKSLKIWDLRQKDCLFTYEGHSRAVNCMRFSPDGRWVISGGEDNVVKVWDLTAGKLIHNFTAHGGQIECLAYHPYEFLLATGSADCTAKLWDVELFQLVGSASSETAAVKALLFTPDGGNLLTATTRGLKVVSWEPILCHDTVDMNWGHVADMAIQDSKLVAVSYQSTAIALWQVDLAQLAPFTNKSKSLDGSDVDSLSDDSEVVMPRAPSPSRKLPQHLHTTPAPVLTPESQVLSAATQRRASVSAPAKTRLPLKARPALHEPVPVVKPKSRNMAMASTKIAPESPALSKVHTRRASLGDPSIKVKAGQVEDQLAAASSRKVPVPVRSASPRRTSVGPFHAPVVRDLPRVERTLDRGIQSLGTALANVGLGNSISASNGKSVHQPRAVPGGTQRDNSRSPINRAPHGSPQPFNYLRKAGTPPSPMSDEYRAQSRPSTPPFLELPAGRGAVGDGTVIPAAHGYNWTHTISVPSEEKVFFHNHSVSQLASDTVSDHGSGPHAPSHHQLSDEEGQRGSRVWHPSAHTEAPASGRSESGSSSIHRQQESPLRARQSPRSVSPSSSAGGPKPLGLNINSFVSMGSNGRANMKELDSLQDDKVIEELLDQHYTMESILQARLTNLQAVKTFWTKNKLKGAIEVMEKLADQGVMVDVLSILSEQSNFLNLELCCLLLPLCNTLLTSAHDRYVATSLKMMSILLRNFSDVISGTRAANRSPGVDVQGENRLERCNLCCERFYSTRPNLESIIRSGGENSGAALQVQAAIEKL